MRVQPYLFFDGRCQEALDFYTSVLNAEIMSIMRFKESPVPPDESMTGPDAGDKIMHATFRIGDSVLMASDGRCQGTPNFEGVSLTITLSAADRAGEIFAALADGGDIQMPMTQTFFAQSFGMVADRFGLSWMVLVEPTDVP
jgi:PhnB protein